MIPLRKGGIHMPKKIKSEKKSNVKKSCLLVPIEEAHLLVALCERGIIDKNELRNRILGS
jgi:hypothetical protein